MAHNRTGPFEGRDQVLSSVAEPRIDERREPREGVNNRQNPELLPGRQLVMHKVHALRRLSTCCARGTLSGSAHVALGWVAGCRSLRSFALTRRFGVLLRSCKPDSL